MTSISYRFVMTLGAACVLSLLPITAYAATPVDLVLGQSRSGSFASSGEFIEYRLPVEAGQRLFMFLEKQHGFSCYFSHNFGASAQTGNYVVAEDQALEATGNASGELFLRVQSNSGSGGSFSVVVHDLDTFPTVQPGEHLAGLSLGWDGDTKWYRVPTGADETVAAFLHKQVSFSTYLSLSGSGLPGRGSNVYGQDQGAMAAAGADGNVFVRIEGNAANGGIVMLEVEDDDSFADLTPGEPVPNQQLNRSGSVRWYRVAATGNSKLFVLMTKSASFNATLSMAWDALPPIAGITGSGDLTLETSSPSSGHLYIRVESKAGAGGEFALTAHDADTFPMLNSGLSRDVPLGFKGQVRHYQVPVRAGRHLTIREAKSTPYFTWLSVAEGGLPNRGTRSDASRSVSLLPSADGYAYVRVEGDSNVPGTVSVTALDGSLDFQSTPSASPNPGLAGEPIFFSAVADSFTGAGVSYTWDFGDGSTGHGELISHVYATAGTYHASVTVAATDGETLHHELTVNIALTAASDSARRHALIVGGAFEDEIAWAEEGRPATAFKALEDGMLISDRWSDANLRRFPGGTATKAAVRDTLAGLAQGPGPIDLVLYVHLGEGVYDAQRKTFSLLFSDGEYASSELISDMNRFSPSTTVIVMLDVPGAGRLLDDARESGGPSNAAWISAFGHSEKAGDDGRVGAFTFALAEACFHGDADGDGFVSFDEAKNHVASRISSGGGGLDPDAVNGDLLRRVIAGRSAIRVVEDVSARVRFSEPLRIVREGNKSYLESANRGRLNVRLALNLPQGLSARRSDQEVAFLGFGFSERWMLAKGTRGRKGSARVTVRKARSRPEVRFGFSFSKRRLLPFLMDAGIADRLLDARNDDITLEMPLLVAAPDNAGLWSIRVPVRFSGARAVIRGKSQ